MHRLERDNSRSGCVFHGFGAGGGLGESRGGLRDRGWLLEYFLGVALGVDGASGDTKAL